MSDQQETEEDFRVRVLAYLTSLGVGTSQLRLERVVQLRVGRQTIDVNTQGADYTLRGRYDLLVVNEQGKNILLAELKRTRQPLTLEDREQAINYARLQKQMPPLVLLSNGKDNCLYHVMSREGISGKEVVAGWSTFSAGRFVVSSDDLRLREEALQLFIGYSQQNVRAFCMAQQSQRMEALRGRSGNTTKKYLPDVYVPRETVRQVFDSFLVSPSPAFVLAGSSGVGKTNEMCALAEETSSTHLSIFLSATELSEAPAKVMADEFNWEFSDQLPLQKICDRLASLVRGTERRVVWFLDAVEECSVDSIEKFVSDIVFHFNRYEGALKFVVSLKSNQWERFAHFGDGQSPLARTCFRAPGAMGAADGVAEASPSITMELMTSGELDNALEKYRAYFEIQGEIVGEMRDVARDPFYLRVLSEVCAEGALDAGLLRRDQTPLLKRYLDQKLTKVAPTARAGLILALELVGRALLEAAKTSGPVEVYSVSERTVIAHASAATWLELPEEAFDASLLIREQDDVGRARVRFQYDRVRDYVNAYHVLRLDAWTPDRFDTELDEVLQNSLRQAALLTFLDASSKEVSEWLCTAAHRKAERFLNAYDRLRLDLGPVLRSHFTPGTVQSIGLVYSFYSHHWWVHGFYARTPDQPRLIARSNYRQEWDELWRGRGDSTVPRTDGLSGSDAWPLLVDPERLAAEVALGEIRKAVTNGGLDGTVSTALDLEKVFAIAGGNRRELELPPTPWQRSEAAAELSADLLPIDVDLLIRRVHAALGARQASRDVALGGGGRSDVAAAMNRAREEAASGKRFNHPPNVRPVPPLAVLADTLDRLQASTPVLEQHYLVLPDSERRPTDRSNSHFEDAYSDARLNELIAKLWMLRLEEYMRLVEANLPVIGPCLREYRALPKHAIAFYRRPSGPPCLGLNGSLLYARLELDDPFPIAPGAALAEGRAGKIQVFPRPETFPFSWTEDGLAELHISRGDRIPLRNGFGETSLSHFLGQSGNQVPLGWRGERKYYFMPLRNSIYSLLIHDLGELDADTILRTRVRNRR